MVTGAAMVVTTSSGPLNLLSLVGVDPCTSSVQESSQKALRYCAYLEHSMVEGMY